MIFTKLTDSLLLLLIFSLPLIPAIFGRGYEEIKVLFLLYGTTIILISFLFKILTTKSEINFLKINYWNGVVIAILLLTALTGINPTQSLLGSQPYFQGWITFLFLAIFSFLVSNSTVAIKKIYWSVILSATLVSGFALYQYIQIELGYFVITYAGRVVSTFGQPNFYAGFLLLSLPFLLDLINKTTRFERIYLLVCLAVIIAAIAVSFSRTAIILSAILLSLWMIFGLVKTKSVRYFLFMLLAAGIFYALIPSRLLQDELLTPLTTKTVELNNAQRRVYIWQAGFAEIQKRPFFGYGLENISDVYPDNYDFNHPKPAFYHSLKDLNIDNTHNLILNILLWGGVLLLVYFSIFLLKIWQLTKNSYQKIAFILFLCWALLQNLSIIHWFFFYLLIGIAAKQSIDTNNSHKVQ